MTLCFVPKQVAKWGPFRSLTRTTATILTPPWTAITKVFESVDRRVGLSTRVLPAFIDLFSRSVLEKQKRKAQAVEGRAITEHGQAALPSARVVGR